MCVCTWMFCWPAYKWLKKPSNAAGHVLQHAWHVNLLAMHHGRRPNIPHPCGWCSSWCSIRDSETSHDPHTSFSRSRASTLLNSAPSSDALAADAVPDRPLLLRLSARALPGGPPAQGRTTLQRLMNSDTFQPFQVPCESRDSLMGG